MLNALDGRKVDRILHLAGMLSLPSEENPWAALNVDAVENSQRSGGGETLFKVGKLIFSSSIAVYSEDLPAGEIFTETTCSRPRTMYGSCKVFGEVMGRFYSRRFHLDFRGVRLPSVVGPFSTAVHMSSYNCWAIEASERPRLCTARGA